MVLQGVLTNISLPIATKEQKPSRCFFPSIVIAFQNGCDWVETGGGDPPALPKIRTPTPESHCRPQRST